MNLMLPKDNRKYPTSKRNNNDLEVDRQVFGILIEDM